MPKVRSQNHKDTIQLRLADVLLSALDQLAEIGVHGSNRSEVARYLIIRGIDDLKGKGYTFGFEGPQDPSGNAK